MDTARLDSVLFDMDGTLIDSEPYWLEAETGLVEEFGGTWTIEQGLALVGSGLWNSAKALHSAGVDMELIDIIDQLHERVRNRLAERVPWRPGALKLIAEILDAGIPTALVTMSFRQNAHFIAEIMTKELGRDAFSTIVAGDDVEEPKPDPEAYLTAASRLNADIHHSIAFEDSVFGAASALSAGAVTVGIPLHVDIPASYTTTMWSSMDGKGLRDIYQAMSEARGIG